MFSVEIRIDERNEEVLTARMNAMREWLIHRRFELSTFRYTSDPPDLLFQVYFKNEAEALAFAAEFAGRVIPGTRAMQAAD